MNQSNGQDIVQRLIDNAAEIIAASTDNRPERLADLANRQRVLTRALEENTSPLISRASIRGLQNLVAKAMDAVRIEMGQNRGSMQATGVRKKVLRAYGTVTVSNTPSR